MTAAATLFVFVAAAPVVEAFGLPFHDGSGVVTADTGLAVVLTSALTVGVVEAVLFRGYPVERVLDVTDSPLVAGGVTWGAFTLAHAAAWSLGKLLPVAAAGVLTAVYLRRRTLVPVVGAHVAARSSPSSAGIYG